MRALKAQRVFKLTNQRSMTPLLLQLMQLRSVSMDDFLTKTLSKPYADEDASVDVIKKGKSRDQSSEKRKRVATEGNTVEVRRIITS